ncbi:MAG: ribonuclease J [Actinomycetota bacterium]
MSSPTRITFFGGLGEIGRNCAMVEVDDRALVIDCGLMFPDAEQPGVDFILPDFDCLRSRAGSIEAVVVTHGHEDHVGALPYFLREFDVPVYGTALSLGLARSRLEEHGLAPRFVVIEGGQRISIGPFEVEFFQVCHSVPDGVALGLRTPSATIVHSGDFRLDPTPIDGRITDLGGLARFAAGGVDLLLSDSTNSEVTGHVRSEADVGRTFAELFGRAEGRIIVTCFASHIHRMQQVFDATAACGRRVALVGRSITRNVSVARELGYLRLSDELVLPVDEIDRHERSKVVVLSTGSQGEPLSALSLIAAGEHRHVGVESGDIVILSSSIVPGNEASVNGTINDLTRAGAQVIHRGTALVHVSGHAAEEELKLMLNIVRPHAFVPVHGEWRHLAAHARLARAVGIPEDNVLICEDGDVIEISREGVEKVDRVDAGMVFVDGLGVGDIGGEVLRDRRILAGDGFVLCVVAVDIRTGHILGEPDLDSRGFVDVPESLELFEEARARVVACLEESAEQGVHDPGTLRKQVRTALGRFFKERTNRRPLIIPTIVEV